MNARRVPFVQLLAYVGRNGAQHVILVVGFALLAVCPDHELTFGFNDLSEQMVSGFAVVSVLIFRKNPLHIRFLGKMDLKRSIYPKRGALGLLDFAYPERGRAGRAIGAA